MSLIQTFSDHPGAYVSTMPKVAPDGQRALVRRSRRLGTRRVAENGDLILGPKRDDDVPCLVAAPARSEPPVAGQPSDVSE